jgi:hypothetical protein
MATRTIRYAAGAALAGYAALQLLGRRAGSSATERQATLPGDDIVARPTTVTNHAITIEAAPESVWPWLTQLGWHLGGYYTPRWVDRWLFPKNWTSLDHLDPALVRNLAVGDIIPDGEPGTASFAVAHVDRPHILVLHSTTHIPEAWRGRYGAGISWTWTFRLTPLPGRRTRLYLRVRGRTTPWWLTAAYHAVLVPADYIMATSMLRGIKHRVESRQAPYPSGRAPFALAEPRDGV